HLARRPALRRRGGRGRLGDRRVAQLTDARGARQHLVPAERVQHDPDRVPGRRPDAPRSARGLADAGDPLRRRRPGAGARPGPDARDRDRRALPRARWIAGARDAGDPPERRTVIDDRSLLDSAHQGQAALREHTALIAQEFFDGFQAVERIDRPAVSIFGSARVPEDSPAYVAARATARLFGEAGWAVITGGGPGVMEAAN